METNFDKTVKVPEEFHRDLYISWNSRDDNGRVSSAEEFDILPVTTQELQKALEVMKVGKVCKVSTEGEVTADLLKHGGKIVIQGVPTKAGQDLKIPKAPS